MPKLVWRQLQPKIIMRYAKRTFRSTYRPILNQRIKRRFQAFAVGLPRSGTHSVAQIFATNYRTAHERRAHTIQLCELIHAHLYGGMNENTFERKLLERDRWLSLEMEANNVPTIILPTLAKIFPEAKFILLMRDPYSWMQSVWSIQYWHLPFDKRPAWYKKKLQFTYGYPRHDYTTGDRILQEVGLLPLKAYLEHWRHAYDLGINQLAAERRLIIYTKELSGKLPEMAQFLNIPASTLNQQNTHVDPAKKKFEYLFQIERDYLEEQVDKICNPLLKDYFPTIHRLEDAVKPPTVSQ